MPCASRWHGRSVQVFRMKPGNFALGSALSRAAARALVTARLESEAEHTWDREIDCTGLAERIRAVRRLAEQGQTERNWLPIQIPPGKENTVRGRLAARINRARARMTDAMGPSGEIYNGSVAAPDVSHVL